MTALLRCFGFDFRYYGRHRMGRAQGASGQQPLTWHQWSTAEYPILRSAVPLVEEVT